MDISKKPLSAKHAKSLESQPCIRALKRAKLPKKLSEELELFVERNMLSDCRKIPPNCLKAHMISTAHGLKLSKKEIRELANLFEAKVGYKGYYLDAGKLKKVPDHFLNF